MHICLDTRNINRQSGTGIATYARSVATACTMSGATQHWLDDGAYCHRHPRRLDSRLIRQIRAARRVRTADLLPCGDWVCPDLYRTAHIRFRQTGALTKIENQDPPEIVHWTTVLPLIWLGPRNIVTIHDLIPLTHPDMTGIDSGVFRRMVLSVCRHARRIVTISEAVRNDILHYLPVSPEHVVNLSQPVDFPDMVMGDWRHAPQLAPPGGFLYFGSLERRKNIERMIVAHKQSGTNRPLTLIGKPGFGLENDLNTIIEDANKTSSVKIIPWAERPTLIRAISEARAVLFPSLAEGFGLPIIEAMHLGVPVLTSSGHATEETAGGAAWLVDPYNTGAIASGIAALASDDALCCRLRILGGKRARSFSCEAFAHRLDALYRDVLNEQGAF